MDKMDKLWCTLPVVGNIFARMFAYFQTHTSFTDAIHLCLGISLPLLFLGYYGFATPFLFVGIGGHIHAYIQGGKLI